MSSTDSFRDRIAGAALALLLQVGFIALFLHALPLFAPPKQLAHELTFFLPPLPRAIPPRPAGTAPRPASRLLAVPLPAIIATPLPEAPSAQTLQNFGQALSGCAPETYVNLTPQQKAQCPRPGEGMAIQQAPNLMGAPSHVKDNPRWANALAHEQSPILLPGGSKDGKMFEIIGIDGSGKASGLLAGSANPESWPTYDVTTYAPEDFYKDEQAMAAWNKAHASAKSVGVHPQ